MSGEELGLFSVLGRRGQCIGGWQKGSEAAIFKDLRGECRAGGFLQFC